MTIKYTTVLADNVSDQVGFFTSVLGYNLIGDIQLWPGINCEILSSNDHDVSIVVIPRQRKLKYRSLIILNTENCLQSFHQIKKAGLMFHSMPHYLPAGLFAEFEDREGNHFILLEERTYEDL